MKKFHDEKTFAQTKKLLRLEKLSRLHRLDKVMKVMNVHGVEDATRQQRSTE